MRYIHALRLVPGGTGGRRRTPWRRSPAPGLRRRHRCGVARGDVDGRRALVDGRGWSGAYPGPARGRGVEDERVVELVRGAFPPSGSQHRERAEVTASKRALQGVGSRNLVNGCAREDLAHLLGGSERVTQPLDHVNGDAVPARFAQFLTPRSLGTTGRVQGERQRQHRVRPDRGSRAAGDPGACAAPTDDERPPVRTVGVECREHREPGPVQGCRLATDPPPAHAPRLVDERDRPPGIHGCIPAGGDVVGPAQSAGTVPEDEQTDRDAVGLGHGGSRRPLGGLHERGRLGTGHLGAPMTSPVTGSTTPTSWSSGRGSSSCGPFARLLLTAGDTGQAVKRPGG
jgi:hypothetical protein